MCVCVCVCVCVSNKVFMYLMSLNQFCHHILCVCVCVCVLSVCVLSVCLSVWGGGGGRGVGGWLIVLCWMKISSFSSGNARCSVR